jgi:hypothetical protein
MTEIDIFPQTDSTLKLNPKGKDPIEIDVFDLDLMVLDLYAENDVTDMPYIDFINGMCKKFKDKYDFDISKMSMDLIMKQQKKKLDKIKKNALVQPEQSDSTAPNPEPKKT